MKPSLKTQQRVVIRAGLSVVAVGFCLAGVCGCGTREATTNNRPTPKLSGSGQNSSGQNSSGQNSSGHNASGHDASGHNASAGSPDLPEPAQPRVVVRDATSLTAQSPAAAIADPGVTDAASVETAGKSAESIGVLPSIPAGARYTIFVDRIEGADHIRRSEELKKRLMQTSGLSDWYVVHEERASLLYHGFYTEIDVTVTQKDAQVDAVRARQARQGIESLLSPATGKPLFPRAVVVKLDSPDPDAPPEWNLANSPGFWTVQIAAYADSPERKRAAVDSVREARAQGVEAYYYHGENFSSVCVGSFPLEAVDEQEVILGSRSNDAVVVTSNINIPDSTAQMRTATGQPVQIRKNVAQIVDPRINAVIEAFPYHSVNGYYDMMQSTDPATGRPKQVPRTSVLMRIPRDRFNVEQGEGRQDVPQLIDPSGRQNQQLGSRLRTLGQ